MWTAWSQRSHQAGSQIGVFLQSPEDNVPDIGKFSTWRKKNVLANLNITKDTIPMFPGKPVTAQAFVFKTRGFQSQPCVFLSGLWEALLAFYCWDVGELWMTAASGRLWCAPKPTETQSPDHRLAAGSLGHLLFAAAPIPDLYILFFLLLLALCTISSL